MYGSNVEYYKIYLYYLLNILYKYTVLLSITYYVQYILSYQYHIIYKYTSIFFLGAARSLNEEEEGGMLRVPGTALYSLLYTVHT